MIHLLFFSECWHLNYISQVPWPVFNLFSNLDSWTPSERERGKISQDYWSDSGSCVVLKACFAKEITREEYSYSNIVQQWCSFVRRGGSEGGGCAWKPGGGAIIWAREQSNYEICDVSLGFHDPRSVNASVRIPIQFQWT